MLKTYYILFQAVIITMNIWGKIWKMHKTIFLVIFMWGLLISLKLLVSIAWLIPKSFDSVVSMVQVTEHWIRWEEDHEQWAGNHTKQNDGGGGTFKDPVLALA